MQIRLALEIDAPAIASVHLRAWQWAYRGQIPDSYLDGLTERLAQREAWWQQHLASPPADGHTWVAETDGQIIGFAGTGPSRDVDAASDVGELPGIYLDPNVVGTGVGRALMAHALADLRHHGFRVATLWVLETNQRARRFYDIAGWQPDGVTKVEQRPGFELHEIRYSIALRCCEVEVA
jgi:GNAT superfamily N-acetyltransferase